MAHSVRLSDLFVKQAQSMARVMSRSSSGQIEHWAKIGRMVEANPELTCEFIRDSLIAKAEVDNGLVVGYEFDC